MPLAAERSRLRAGRAPLLRAPGSPRAHALVRLPEPPERPALRLAVSRGKLGIELDAPFALGPIVVTDLALALSNVRFPVDLSGGVTRFRHRRGALHRVVVESGAVELAAWVAPKLRGLFGESAPEVVIAPFDEGLIVGLRFGASALAFDVVVAPHEGDLRLLPERARGIGLGVPPHALALRALVAACAPLGRFVQGAVVIPGAAAQLVRQLLPAAGARAPGVEGVRWEAPAFAVPGDGALRMRLEASSGAAPPALAERTLRALELAELAAPADDAACAGDWETARRRYLGVLERAPRHPEASQRLAWLDATLGERAEAALSTVVDAMPAANAGILGGRLLAAVGDQDGALVAYRRSAEAEPFGTLAALTWLAAAPLAPSLDVRLDALDRAVARAPAIEHARWARLTARLDVADLRGARADAEHLEAAARGVEARHAVWRRAATEFLERGHVVEASALFERALRYAPEDPVAVVGLARSLRAAGQGRRALDLFARAVTLADRAGAPLHSASIELARGLAEVAGDRPAAVARVRAVPPGLAESCEARFLEGRWRADLGDLAGAMMAFGRLRDAVALVAPSDPTAVAAMLMEAAAVEEHACADVHAAQQSLGLALRLRPHDRRLAADFRRVAALVAGASSRVLAPPVPQPPGPPPPQPEEVPPAEEAMPAEFQAQAVLGSDHDEVGEEADESIVQTLMDRLRADPRDHATAMTLALALERLGRDLDLLALLSARLEEGEPEERREVVPMRRAVLLRLAQQTRQEGRISEAELYDMMAASDPD